LASRELTSARDFGMPFVSVFVFRQKMRKAEVDRVLDDVPNIFARISQSRGESFDKDKVSVVLVDGAARNVFSPESHAKGFQGLDILLLVFAKISEERNREELREALETQFRDKWVTRARIFDVEDDKWKVGRWTDDDAVVWNPSGVSTAKVP